VIKPINRKVKERVGLYEIVAEFDEQSRENAEHHQDGPALELEIVFVPANKQYGIREAYVAYIDGEIEGEFEYCSKCWQGWVAFAGDIHDEDYCIFCYAPRD
jgi:hypothetical protein